MANTNLKEGIYTALLGDATLSGLIGSNVFYGTLPENWPNSSDCIVFTLRTTETYRDLSGGSIIGKLKQLDIKVNSINLSALYDIADAAEDAVTSNFDFVTNEIDDEPFWDPDLDWYTITLSIEINEF